MRNAVIDLPTMERSVETDLKHVCKEEKQQIEKLLGAYQDAVRITIKRAYKVGKILFEVKSQLIGQGTWLAWLKASGLNISQPTADKYIKIYENWDKIATQEIVSINKAIEFLVKEDVLDQSTDTVPSNQTKQIAPPFVVDRKPLEREFVKLMERMAKLKIKVDKLPKKKISALLEEIVELRSVLEGIEQSARNRTTH